MSMINCLDCGKLMIINYNVELCVDCELVQKEKVYAIKIYMYNNPGATRMDVHMETGISLRVIDRMSVG